MTTSARALSPDAAHPRLSRKRCRRSRPPARSPAPFTCAMGKRRSPSVRRWRFGPTTTSRRPIAGTDGRSSAGVTPTALFAEVLGRQSGLNGGRGASPYFSAASRELRRRELDRRGRGADRLRGGAEREARRAGRVSVVALGDGATNQGAVHEGSTWPRSSALPLIVIDREQPLLRDDADLRAGEGRPAGRAWRCVRHRIDDRRRQRSRRCGRRRHRCGRPGPLGRRTVTHRGDDPAHRRAPHRRRAALPTARRDRAGEGRRATRPVAGQPPTARRRRPTTRSTSRSAPRSKPRLPRRELFPLPIRPR